MHARMTTMPAGLLALAIGGFGIGLTEFVILGLLPEVASDLAVSEATAGWLISGYALTVAVGAVALTASVARLRGATIAAGLGFTAPIWAGAALTAAGLGVLLIADRNPDWSLTTWTSNSQTTSSS